MAKHLKTWSSLGLAALGTASVADAATLGMMQASQHQPGYILIQDEGEGGEGGGEGGGGALTTYAIASTNPDDFAYSAEVQVDAYIDLVHSSYSRSKDAAAAMQAAIDAFLANPDDETLTAARQAWVTARPAYLKTEVFRFYDGPIEAVESAINAWPMNEAFIDYVDGNLAAGIVNDPATPLNAADLLALNQATDDADVAVGWHAVEFLLWGQDLSATGPGNRPASDYVSGSGSNDRRRAYLSAITAQLVTDIAGLETAWDAGKAASYAANLKTLPEREVIGRMLNGMAILAGFEFMSERLAVALDSGDQEDEHSCFSDTTRQDFVYDMEGILQVWTGDNDGTSRAGLDDLVRAQDPALADKVDGLLAAAKAKIDALGDPWDQVLASPPGSPERLAAEDLVLALQDLGAGLVETGAQLGVLVLVP